MDHIRKTYVGNKKGREGLPTAYSLSTATQDVVFVEVSGPEMASISSLIRFRRPSRSGC